MHWIVGIVAIMFCLILVVGVHEAGHAVAARWCGVKIYSIAIGFGRPLLTWRDRKGRKWIWGLWPIGGYVHLLNSRTQTVTAQQKLQCFDQKSIWRRIVILSAGIVVNLFVAWLALTLLFLIGRQEVAPVIAKIRPHSIAAKAHLAANDRLLSINDQPTLSWQSVGMQLLMNMGKDHVPVIVKSANGILHQTHLDLQVWDKKMRTYALLTQIGLIPDHASHHTYRVHSMPVNQAISAAWDTCVGLLKFYLVLLKQILTGVIPFFLLLGPFSLFSNMADSFAHGIAVFLLFIAHLNLTVALMNILPIPGLDGCSILYALVEKIRRKPMSVALEVLLYRLAFIVFVMVWAQLLANDLKRYFG